MSLLKKYDRRFFWLTVLSLSCVFILLAYRNPFETRSLVSNLEPYPDTLFYITPAWNFIHGNGFGMFFHGISIPSETPPLYSLYLIPFFALVKDVRVFYIANMLIALLSLFFFIKTLQLIFQSAKTRFFIIFVLGLFYVTNFYLYTMPSLALAEIMSLFLLVLSTYLLFSNITRIKLFISSVLGVIFLLVKFSNAPLMIIFYLLYGYKVYFSSQLSKKVKLHFFVLVVTSFLILFLYILGSNILKDHKNLQKGQGFSPKYFIDGVTFYITSLFGRASNYLWYRNKMIPNVLGIFAVIGMSLSLLFKKTRNHSFQLILLGGAMILFMSFFYMRDIRYIIVLLPIFSIFIGLLFEKIESFFGQFLVIISMLGIIGFFLFFPNQSQIQGERVIITLKKQIGLNLRHTEDPWNYRAVLEFNNFFKENEKEKPYLGTFLPPFYVDYFTNQNYTYIPLSKTQEFSSGRDDLLDKLYQGDLFEHYLRLLSEGKMVYISNAYITNVAGWRNEFEKFNEKFQIKLVKRGCFDTCNIYRLEREINQ